MTHLADIWSATEFPAPELTAYAEKQIRADTRRGVQILAALSLIVQLCASALVLYRGTGAQHVYTYLTLSVLSLHVLVSAHFVDDARALQVLGMVLLIVSALAITFLAHRTRDLNVGMMAAIVMLFIAIPLVPWALREAAVVMGLTYVLLTSSLISVPGKFEPEALWAIQLLVLGSSVVVAVIVSRNTYLRRQEIRTRFDLEKAHKAMELLSMKDHLTGAWNRRFLDSRFPEIAGECRKQRKPLQVAVLDIDDFKGVNDRYGHQLADEILSSLGEIFIKHLGQQGYLIRLGGDEFQILYRGDDLGRLISRAIAELHDEPAAKRLANDRRITISAGICSTGPDRFDALDTLYKAADTALYSAKHERNPPRITDTEVEAFTRTGTWQL